MLEFLAAVLQFGVMFSICCCSGCGCFFLLQNLTPSTTLRLHVLSGGCLTTVFQALCTNPPAVTALCLKLDSDVHFDAEATLALANMLRHNFVLTIFSVIQSVQRRNSRTLRKGINSHGDFLAERSSQKTDDDSIHQFMQERRKVRNDIDIDIVLERCDEACRGRVLDALRICALDPSGVSASLLPFDMRMGFRAGLGLPLPIHIRDIDALLTRATTDLLLPWQTLRDAGSWHSIGRGAFGQVYRVRFGDRDVCIKCLGADHDSQDKLEEAYGEIALFFDLMRVCWEIGVMVHRGCVSRWFFLQACDC
jgi:hypothetical protein